VAIDEPADGFSVSQVQSAICIKKIVLSFRDKNRIKAVHRFANAGAQPREFAVQALSLMNTGGFAILPQDRKKEDEHAFLPSRNLVLWTGTGARDKGFTITPGNYIIRHGGLKPFKIGRRVTLGSAVNIHRGNLFVKRSAFDPAPACPDFQANGEIYNPPSPFPSSHDNGLQSLSRKPSGCDSILPSLSNIHPSRCR
jgi:hypothetical protein